MIEKILRLKKRNSKASSGFTLVELMIATTVFSVILLLSLAGFLQIGQLFYKGVNITQSTDTAKQIITSIKNDLSYDTSNTTLAIYPAPLASPSTQRFYFCVGANRYSFIPYKQLNREDKDTGPSFGWYKFRLLKDRLDVVNSSCPNPFNNSGAPLGNDATELLGDKMRLSKLEITPLPSSNDKLYTVVIKIVYGDDSVLDNANTAEAKCKSGASYARYCFATDLRTTVRKGFQP